VSTNCDLLRQRNSFHPSDLVPQCLSLQQFHGDKGSPIGLVNLVDGAYSCSLYSEANSQLNSAINKFLETGKRFFTIRSYMNRSLTNPISAAAFRAIESLVGILN
jgi:hypothetical protein